MNKAVCSSKDCGAEAEYLPVIVVHRGDGTVRAVADLPLCLFHRSKAKTPKDVLVEPEKLVEAFRGERATLDWSRYNSAEGRKFRELKEKRLREEKPS